jgi:cell cycle sensor histidine kinase DivJ
VKFTDRGGRVQVAAHVEGADILVTVEDTGVGISADDLTLVGRPFFQARGAYDRRHDGTGLGLSIVQGLVALHGGTVNIASRLGEGTCITVRLPVNCEPVRPARKPSNVTHPSFDRVAEAVADLIKKTA